MENDSTLYVGLDVHKDSITVAYAPGTGEVELLGKLGTTKTDIDRLCKRLQSKARCVHVVYEAGPCGYGLYRQLVQKGFDCMVCAPSLIPRKPGERVKTDRRDAVKLVRSLRAGDLSAVYVPGVEDGAFRDLARAWVTAKDDLRHARQRLKAFLLSHSVRYAGRADWGPSHRRWLSTYSFESAWQQLAFDEQRRTIEDRLANGRSFRVVEDCGGNRHFNRERGEPAIILKIGAHCGPSIAVTLNDNLDYFGQAVNVAARVQSLADAGEICISEALYSSPGVRDLLAGRTVVEFEAPLRGLRDKASVYRIASEW